ncbi:dTDP-glucose pyrophosphorylase [Aliifodinibius salipaludis]|uniref:glucose-1-phosphate thymidylyltransferase n=1 Tax=Fodinibius salipaludis TaxID=2032627 RepID=A0A2A2G9M7_9BACT|nr:sugar phosphate nucleotidyltransferase [Aliifodinibius salipaludis]PAU94008.1 dTDP-glucose pyrophosphorylase [Aliifodinibius salipaludis]
MIDSSDVIGLIPAAGFATRIAPMLSCSKEMQSVTLPDGSSRVVSSFLLEALQYANVKKTYFILRRGKWDIPEYFSNGYQSEMDLAYIVSEATQGVPFTIDKAYPFVKESRVLLGFPDIIFKPVNAYQKILDCQRSSGADLVLGLFKTDKPEKADMIGFDAHGNINEILIKPKKTGLLYTWIMAAWTPAFSRYIHSYVQDERRSHTSQKELYLGDIVKKAIYDGLSMAYVKFDEGAFIDIGTPAELEKVKDENWMTQFYSDTNFKGILEV